MGIGFAIPSKVVRGWIGVSIQEVTQDLAQEFGAADTNGALVADVMDDSPASKAKLERGDIILSYIQWGSLRDPGQLRSLVAETAPGTTVTLSLLREKKRQDLSVTIGELPKELASARDGSGKGEHALAGMTVENLKSQTERLDARNPSPESS